MVVPSLNMPLSWVIVDYDLLATLIEEQNTHYMQYDLIVIQRRFP